MRQKTQTINDSKFRVALENMRYKNCTTDDIEHLHRMASSYSVSQKIQDDRFRNVSVITALNVHRDRINELGSKRFAADHGEKLISFYSKDTWPTGAKSDSMKKQKTSINQSAQAQLHAGSKDINPSLQRVLWELPPDASDHRSGALNICKGLPILIKYNEATECCVTNGAEAKVIDWISYVHPQSNKVMLKTLFVELQNPPISIQLDGLPMNVVPISPESKVITCDLPDGTQLKINRSQIPVIPNFAMTDYCSQGRTRPFNIVHLNNCRTHQSYYTCLSRSASHEGTLIVNGFNSGTITGGLSGNLRQEFRELELLDDISKLRYESLLPNNVNGKVRREIITQYRTWKGEGHIPANVHAALQWSKTCPFLLGPCDNAKWQIVQNKRKGATKPLPLPVGHKNLASYVPVQSDQVTSTISQKIPITKFIANYFPPQTASNNEIHNTFGSAHKEYRNKSTTGLIGSVGTSWTMQMPPTPQHPISQPTGMIWDSQDYSCAYDSLFTIIWNMWKEDPHFIETHSDTMQNMNFHSLIGGYSNHQTGQVTLEHARNMVRNQLHNINSEKFPYGQNGVEIKDLLSEMFQYNPNHAIGHELTFCQDCGLHPLSYIGITSNFYTFYRSTWQRSADIHNLPSSPDLGNTEQCAALFLKSQRISTPCTVCRKDLVVSKIFYVVPELLVMYLGRQNSMHISHSFDVHLNSRSYTFRLRGMIYFGSFHFTSQFVDKDSNVWYHDGVSTGQKCELQGALRNLSNNQLLNTHNRYLCTVIYSLQ